MVSKKIIYDSNEGKPRKGFVVRACEISSPRETKWEHDTYLLIEVTNDEGIKHIVDIELRDPACFEWDGLGVWIDDTPITSRTRNIIKKTE